MQSNPYSVNRPWQGYLIDKATADAHRITTLDQLKDPEIAKLFDIDDNGKADLYGCETGWGCERVIEHQLDAYELRDTVEHRQGGCFAIIPDAVERIQSGQPTLYYTWTPLWLSGVLRPGHEVTWLTVPFTSLPGRIGREGRWRRDKPVPAARHPGQPLGRRRRRSSPRADQGVREHG